MVAFKVAFVAFAACTVAFETFAIGFLGTVLPLAAS